MRLVVDGLVKNFGDKKVLKGASFTFEKGKIYGLLGRNGAGKTTLFNCIRGDLDYEAGSIDLRGQENEKKIEEQVGLVYTEPLLPEFLTGEEFLRFFITANRNRIGEPLSLNEYFELIKFEDDDRHRLIKGYSHGMKNKIQLLTVLITRPPIILLDEPLTSFDVVVALEIKQLLKAIKAEHIIIFSTHVLQLAVDLCDEIVMLHGGKLKGIDSGLLGKPEFEESITGMLTEEEDA
ncbi:MAG: ABC transporter ATP-binding protein [Firmicutes bacterium]|jgi:ABC-2 type transport system ATP-binding protein|nr:ABC transporter ATP-binding protein [Bacillota bacterium]